MQIIAQYLINTKSNGNPEPRNESSFMSQFIDN